MMPKSFNVLVLLFAILTVCSASINSKHKELDVSQYDSVYYDPETGVGLEAQLDDSGRNPFMSRIAFQGLSCKCEQQACTCCAGVNMTAIKVNHLACTKFVYIPDLKSIQMSLIMNQKEVFSTTLSGLNPPPMCVPLPPLPIINFCVRFYDIRVEGRNVNICIDFETRVSDKPIFVLHFRCVKIGLDGISWSKPGEAQIANQAVPIPQDLEVYDEVEFEQQDLEVYSNYTSTLSPEEEAQIGQLKL